MIVSIVTPVFNRVATIESCIKSVLDQSYPHIEHIIIDGSSTDGTVDVIKRYANKIAYWVSERDSGIYNAMNKGIKVATGDIVGMLNSDDIYAGSSVIEDVVRIMSEGRVDSCYGDLVYVDRNDISKVIRYWKSGRFFKGRFKRGWMPPHPTFFVRREAYRRYGFFNTDFPIAADYELMLRFLYKLEISTIYIPKILVKMRIGGNSNPGLYTTTKAIIENYKAWKVNGLNPNPIIFILKPASKILQIVRSAVVKVEEKGNKL